MLQINTREATINDLATLLTFEQGVISAERPFDSTLKDDPIHYYDIGKMILADDVHLIVAECEENTIGCGYARIENVKPFLKYPQHAYLGFMYVVPEFRGKGVNKIIIDALAKWVATKNITELRLEVYYNNSAAIKAYEKAGFSRLLIQMRKEI